MLKATLKPLPVRRTVLAKSSESQQKPVGTPGRLDYPVGVVTLAEPFSELIPAGVALPRLFSDTFGNAEDNQQSVGIKIVQRRPEGTETIASLTIDDLPPAPKGMLHITLTISINREKELRVKATITEKGYVREYGPVPVR